VISNLDRPKPQVLIKVVFVELTHNNSSDIGIEGGFTRNLFDGTNNISAWWRMRSGCPRSNLPSAGSNAPLGECFGQPRHEFCSDPPGAGLYQISARLSSNSAGKLPRPKGQGVVAAFGDRAKQSTWRQYSSAKRCR